MKLCSTFVVCLLALAAYPQTTPIQHVVILYKENRSFDHYFGQFPGANGATSCHLKNYPDQPMAPATYTNLGHDLCHSWDCSHYDIDQGKMDRFWLPGQTVQASMVCSQFSASTIPNYWAMATHFALSDNFFSTLSGPSFPNHLMSIEADDDDAVIGNPQPNGATGPGAGVDNGVWGCGAVSSATVATLGPGYTKRLPVFPCFEHATIFDRLDGAGLSWRYYSPAKGAGGYGWNATQAICHLYTANLTGQVGSPETQFVSDVAAGKLAAVTYIVQGATSEHPPDNVCKGENWSVQVVNALAHSPFWDSTVVFIAWDDFGGFYDHVPPPNIDFWGDGMRVPLIILGGAVKPGAISHQARHFDSLLAFIEYNWGLAPLGVRDQYPDDFSDVLDFTQTNPPLVLPLRTCPTS